VSDIFTASSKTAKPSILTRKHLSWQIWATFGRAGGANTGLALRWRGHARQQISAEIHTNAPASGLLNASRFLDLHAAQVDFPAEWAQTFIYIR
jgi:hypothetical protein